MSEEFHDWLDRCPVQWFRGEVNKDHVAYYFETPDEDEDEIGTTSPDQRQARKGKRESRIRTAISFDKGGTWGPLKPPEFDSLGNKVECASASCSLHLHGTTSTEALSFAPFYSMPNAAGIILGTGNVGEYPTLFAYMEHSVDHGQPVSDALGVAMEVDSDQGVIPRPPPPPPVQRISREEAARRRESDPEGRQLQGELMRKDMAMYLTDFNEFNKRVARQLGMLTHLAMNLNSDEARATAAAVEARGDGEQPAHMTVKELLLYLTNIVQNSPAMEGLHKHHLEKNQEHVGVRQGASRGQRATRARRTLISVLPQLERVSLKECTQVAHHVSGSVPPALNRISNVSGNVWINLMEQFTRDTPLTDKEFEEMETHIAL